ncbi:MAG: helix-turn-helix transcriptional regulator [Promethearchaeota archaeon]
MFSKKIRLKKGNKQISVATALVLMAIEELIPEHTKDKSVVYGYQIMSHLKDNYNWNVKSGTVYPILKKLNKEMYIAKGVGPDTESSKRQTIFYRITKKGRRTVNEIRSLNDEALDTALTSGEPPSKNSAMKFIENGFSLSNMADGYLGPILRDFCMNVAELISKQPMDKLGEIDEEIEKSLEKLDSVKKILNSERDKIKTLKRL